MTGQPVSPSELLHGDVSAKRPFFFDHFLQFLSCKPPLRTLEDQVLRLNPGRMSFCTVDGHLDDGKGKQRKGEIRLFRKAEGRWIKADFPILPPQ